MSHRVDDRSDWVPASKREATKQHVFHERLDWSTVQSKWHEHNKWHGRGSRTKLMLDELTGEVVRLTDRSTAVSTARSTVRGSHGASLRSQEGSMQRGRDTGSVRASASLWSATGNDRRTTANDRRTTTADRRTTTGADQRSSARKSAAGGRRASLVEIVQARRQTLVDGVVDGVTAVSEGIQDLLSIHSRASKRDSRASQRDSRASKRHSKARSEGKAGDLHLLNKGESKLLDGAGGGGGLRVIPPRLNPPADRLVHRIRNSIVGLFQGE